MTLQLSKRVPARIKTVTATWCHKNFLEMTDQYRQIRAKFRRKMDKCFWCGHPFANGEIMALACFDEHGNDVVCQSCADKLLASNAEEVDV